MDFPNPAEASLCCCSLCMISNVQRYALRGGGVRNVRSCDAIGGSSNLRRMSHHARLCIVDRDVHPLQSVSDSTVDVYLLLF